MASKSAIPAEQPKLGHPKAEPVVVALVVDQLAGWLLEERVDALPPEGGFARLLREGSYLVDMRYLHAVTDTAPGHAALFTGVPPRENGVFANEWLDLDSGEKRSVLYDADAQLVTKDGISERPGSSARPLGTPTVADKLRQAHPDALIVSLSIKDRAAIFGGGRSPSATVWYDSKSNEFLTSTAFATQLIGFARTPDASAWQAFTKRTWEPMDSAWLAQHAAEPDAAPGEGVLAGKTASFPHNAGAAEEPTLGFRASPSADQALIDLAIRALDALPFGEHPALLAVSLSSNDYVGHVYGPDSWEWWDNFRRLDAELLRLLAALDARLGADSYAVVLSADHGVGVMPETLGTPGARPWCGAPTPDRYERPCEPGGRVPLASLVDKLEAAAERSVGRGHWVLGTSNPYVYLTKEARSLPEAKRERLLGVLKASLEKEAGIETAVLSDKLAPCAEPPNESRDALICRSLSAGSGDLYVVAKPGWFLDVGYTPLHGANHGSYRLHDRSVPLLARAPGRIPAGARVETAVSFATFTRTLSTLLGVAAPERAYSGSALVQQP